MAIVNGEWQPTGFVNVMPGGYLSCESLEVGIERLCAMGRARTTDRCNGLGNALIEKYTITQPDGTPLRVRRIAYRGMVWTELIEPSDAGVQVKT